LSQRKEAAVEIMGLTWVGIRTNQHDETVAFFADVLRLPVLADDSGFTVLGVADGSTVEVFGPDSLHNQHLTAPVPGFRVRDLHAAHDELIAAGVEIVLPIQGGAERRWLHARGPDGFLFELVQSD
jgi:catechol 2,3-dioxygenase-like lactoylglutathione lyase family enzyme